jgi:hypothetical protein
MDQYSFDSFGDWEKQLESEIENFKAAAIFLGKSGLGPRQIWEIERLISEIKKQPENRRLGLVMLPGYSQGILDEIKEKWPILLKWQWVDFTQDDPDPVEKLILGVAPKQKELSSKLEKTASIKIENRELRTEIFEIVSEGFLKQGVWLDQVAKKERVLIHETIAKTQLTTIETEQKAMNLVNSEMKDVISGLENIEQRFKSAAALLIQYEDKLAELACDSALSDIPNLDVQEKNLVFQESYDWLKAEIASYIGRIAIHLVSPNLDFLRTPIQNQSKFHSDTYIKALDCFKELVLDFELDTQVYEEIEASVNTLNKIMKYR